jgi:hypothetical protein
VRRYVHMVSGVTWPILHKCNCFTAEDCGILEGMVNDDLEISSQTLLVSFNAQTSLCLVMLVSFMSLIHVGNRP